jgi:endonuclease/exonuclease/phosphatase family metal-dependent hydrolase
VTSIRVASWNLEARTGDAASNLGTLLADCGGADLVLLQEASSGGMAKFCEAAELDWWVHIRDEFPDLLRVSGRAGGTSSSGEKYPAPRCVAMAGRGSPPTGIAPFPDLPLPEKALAAWVDLGGIETTIVCYHAPTGVQHRLKKPAQAVRMAEWLAAIDGPAILGGDFNTPELDPPSTDRIRTHWHTGDSCLEGQPGDDLLVGADPIHGLRDVLRVYLDENPDELHSVEAARPDGPLALSYRTGQADEQRMRYDAIWTSGDFRVESVDYFYDAAIEAGTGHALVLATLAARQSDPPSG